MCVAIANVCRGTDQQGCHGFITACSRGELLRCRAQIRVRPSDSSHSSIIVNEADLIDKAYQQRYNYRLAHELRLCLPGNGRRHSGEVRAEFEQTGGTFDASEAFQRKAVQAQGGIDYGDGDRGPGRLHPGMDCWGKRGDAQANYRLPHWGLDRARQQPNWDT